MAFNPVTGLITPDQATVPVFLTHRLVRDMVHGEEGYFRDSNWGTSVLDRGKDEKRLWINGNAQVYNSRGVADIMQAEDEPGMSYVIRICKTVRGVKFDGYFVDDSAFRYDENITEDEKLPRLDWENFELLPLKVIGHALDRLSAARMEETIAKKFRLRELGSNVLLAYAHLS